jgi:hypothetical protein
MDFTLLANTAVNLLTPFAEHPRDRRTDRDASSNRRSISKGSKSLYALPYMLFPFRLSFKSLVSNAAFVPSFAITSVFMTQGGGSR